MCFFQRQELEVLSISVLTLKTITSAYFQNIEITQMCKILCISSYIKLRKVGFTRIYVIFFSIFILRSSHNVHVKQEQENNVNPCKPLFSL